MLPNRAAESRDDGDRLPDLPAHATAFERGLRELTFPTTLRELLPRPVQARWMVLLWVVLAVMVVGLLTIRAAYLGLTSVKW